MTKDVIFMDHTRYQLNKKLLDISNRYKFTFPCLRKRCD